MKRFVGLLGLAFACTVTPAAAAELTVQAPAAAPNLGKVIRGTSATRFDISPEGAVTQTSGDAIRLGGASVSTPTIRLTCALISLPNLCIVRYIQVTIQPAASSGPASVTMLRTGPISGATYRDGLPAEAAALTFILRPMGVGTTTFQLGMDVLLAAGAASGTTAFNYTVTAVFL
jgi:hypothetical protein